MNRRKFLMASGAVAAVGAVAGCAGNSGQKTAQTKVDEMQAMEKPEPPAQPPDNDYWRFVIESVEYQNDMAEATAIAVGAMASSSE